MTCNISNINFLKFSFSKKATKVAQSFSWFGHLPEKLIFTTSRRKESRCPGLKDASKCYRPIIHPKSLTLGSVGYFDDYIFVPWSVEISREVWWLEPINDRFSQATPVSYAKGQLISECLFDVLNFPKNQRKIWQISTLEYRKWSYQQNKDHL